MNTVKYHIEFKVPYTGKWTPYTFDSENLAEARDLEQELIAATDNRYEYRIVKVTEIREVVE